MDKLNSDTSRYKEVVDHSAPASFLIPGTDEIEQSRDHGCNKIFVFVLVSHRPAVVPMAPWLGRRKQQASCAGR